MGEYATRKTAVTKENPWGYETICKVGTCDDWRYVRRTEAETLAVGDAGGGTNFPATLAEPSILYRFPFPDEDHDGLKEIRERDMFRSIHFAVPRSELQINHGTKVVHMTLSGGGYGVNVWVPCPARDDFSKLVLQHSPLPERIPVTVYGERHENGMGRTILRCGWCEEPFSLGVNDLEEWRRVFVKYHDNRREWAETVAARFTARLTPAAVTS